MSEQGIQIVTRLNAARDLVRRSVKYASRLGARDVDKELAALYGGGIPDDQIVERATEIAMRHNRGHLRELRLHCGQCGVQSDKVALFTGIVEEDQTDHGICLNCVRVALTLLEATPEAASSSAG